MLVPSSDTNDLLSVMCYWNRVRMGRCQVMKAHNEYMHKGN